MNAKFKLALSGWMLAAIVSAAESGRGVRDLAPPGWAKAPWADGIMERPGVMGYGLSKDVDNRPEIHVYLGKTSDGAGLPPFIDDMKVKKVVTGKIYALARPTCGKKNLPPCPGDDDDGNAGDTCSSLTFGDRLEEPIAPCDSVGAYSITACTLGAKVYDDSSGKALLLSNNHCFADENRRQQGDAICHPGPYDASGSCNRIGGLKNYVHIHFDDQVNFVDAATSSIDQDINVAGEACYGTPSSSIVDPIMPRMPVMKCGRTTGLTTGRIDATNAALWIQYDQGIALFRDQITIKGGAFSAGGDSGSLIVTLDEKRPVGLLFAGSSRITIANKIDRVVGDLDVHF